MTRNGIAPESFVVSCDDVLVGDAKLPCFVVFPGFSFAAGFKSSML